MQTFTWSTVLVLGGSLTFFLGANALGGIANAFLGGEQHTTRAASHALRASGAAIAGLVLLAFPLYALYAIKNGQVSGVCVYAGSNQTL